MHRDAGLSRATTVTAGLAGVALVGVVAVAGLARHDTTAGTQTSTSTDSNSTNSTSNSSTSGSSDESNSYPLGQLRFRHVRIQFLGRWRRHVGRLVTMPLVETLPVGTGCAQWSVWGTIARIVVTDPARLDGATAVVRAELAAVDAACSRFRTDSEVRDVFRAKGRPITVSVRLAELVRAALDAAVDSNGDVDPTLGLPMSALGYDRDFAAITTGASPVHPSLTAYEAAGWRTVRLDGRELTVPAGVLLDLGATAKAWAADRCAALVAEHCDTGVLVALGGDIATAGPAAGPTAGALADSGSWRVRVQDGPDEPACTVTLPGGAALATSSTIARKWRSGARSLHHILDPRTGQPAPRVWRTASVAAYTCVRANTLSTAALVRGARAPRWLDTLGAPARLVAADGRVVTLGTWPTQGIGSSA
jgi:thiamine biosynthesis lipoprotein